MKIPELSKEHKIAIFILVLIIIIILVLLATPTADNASINPDTEKIITQSENTEVPKSNKNAEAEAGKIRETNDSGTVKVEGKKDKSQAEADPEMVSMEQLFAPYRQDKSRVPEKASTPMSIDQFCTMVDKEINSFSEKDFQVIEKALLNAENLNIGRIGLEFINSKNDKLQVLGFELITKASIGRIDFFMPNKFFMAFAKKGFAAEPFITEIIESTKDDFCREWACELYVDIFYHNTDAADGRHRKLTEYKDKEKEVYQKIVKLFANEENVKKIVESKERVGDQIRLMWGKDNRCSMKMLEVIKLIDNLNEKNQYPTRLQILKVISTYNFNYNILNHVDGKPVDLPPVPEQIKLKYLANAVFKDGVTNTFKWLHKQDGGFTLEEVQSAVKENDLKKIEQMNKVLHKIISSILRGKLLLGLGNHEIELLRYFSYASWEKKPFNWEDNLIIVRNMTGVGAPLLLSQKPDPGKMLTGNVGDQGIAEEKHQAFYIPPQSTFVWSAKDGDYILSVNLENTAIRPEHMLNFEDKKFTVKNNNMTFEIF